MSRRKNALAANQTSITRRATRNQFKLMPSDRLTPSHKRVNWWDSFDKSKKDVKMRCNRTSRQKEKPTQNLAADRRRGKKRHGRALNKYFPSYFVYHTLCSRMRLYYLSFNLMALFPSSPIPHAPRLFFLWRGFILRNLPKLKITQLSLYFLLFCAREDKMREISFS